jgi:hypothetical protein
MVRVEANDQVNPTTPITYGADVRVKGYPTGNPPSCSCQCQNSSGTPINCGSTNSTSCGTGIGFLGVQASQTDPKPNVTQQTVFKVSCPARQ